MVGTGCFPAVGQISFPRRRQMSSVKWCCGSSGRPRGKSLCRSSVCGRAQPRGSLVPPHWQAPLIPEQRLWRRFWRTWLEANQLQERWWDGAARMAEKVKCDLTAIASEKRQQDFSYGTVWQCICNNGGHNTITNYPWSNTDRVGDSVTGEND